MTKEQISTSLRTTYKVSPLTKLLWWLSTAEEELLTDAVIDRNRYKIIGITVLGTWLFATMIWTYFFSTIVTEIYIYLPLGIFMGFIILSIDRALIKGITKFNKRKAAPLLFRGLLALTIGTFMAQPAVLYMFKQEIKLQTSLDNEKKKMDKHTELEKLYAERKETIRAEDSTLTAARENTYTTVNAARDNYLAETDGSGGSGKVGISTIANAKKAAFENLQTEAKGADSIYFARTAALRADKNAIDSSMKKAEQEFETYLNDGFLTQVSALQNILKESTALKFRYYLIVFILMLIELMPVIAKTMLPSGTYDDKVLLRETLEKEIAANNIEKERILKLLYADKASAHDLESLKKFFEAQSANGTDIVFDAAWEQYKTDRLSKQEN